MPPPQFYDDEYTPGDCEFLFYKSVFHIPYLRADEPIVARKSRKHAMILGCAVQAIFSQEAVQGNAGWRINNDVKETELERVWSGGHSGVENSRLQMRLMNGRSMQWMCDNFETSKWEITVDMWATEITGDKIHLRTLIEKRMDGVELWGDEDFGSVTKYFTPTDEEISLNTGGQGFYFTCIVQSDLKLYT